MAANMQKQAVILLKGEAPLVASGVENYLLNNASLTVSANSAGTVQYVDSERVQAGQIIACGSYQEQQELALGYNFEDAIVVNERLIKEDILTSLFAKKYIVIRKKLKVDKKPKEEEFYPRPEISHLDQKGIVKVGSEIRENDVLVSKRTPYKKQQAEELLIASIMGEEAHSFMDTSFRLPWGEKESIVYAVNHLTKEEIYQRGSGSYSADDLEAIEICVVQKRRIEAGDKLTTRFGNKGVVGKIVPEIDMPFDANGQTIDIIFNPLSVPSRMNIEQIAQIAEESGLQDYGLTRLYDGQTGLSFDQKVLVGYIYTIKLNHMVADKFHARNTGPYALVHQQPVKGRAHGGGQRRELVIKSSQSESFNLLLQYLRGIGFDLTAEDFQGKNVDFYKQFKITNSKTLNASTLEPEIGGLFCPKIFGPARSYQCACHSDQSRRIKHQKCENCGVLIASSNIRRWRMGHLALVSPVTNTLLLKGILPHLEKLLEIPGKAIKDLVYFHTYVVLDRGNSTILQNKQILAHKIDPELISQVLTELIQAGEAKSSPGGLKKAQELQASLLGQKKKEIQSELNQVKKAQQLEKNEKQKAKLAQQEVDLQEKLNQAKLEKVNSRKRFIQSLLQNNLPLTGLILNYVPILPAGLRPATKLDDGSIATTQQNNPNRKLILTNERLKNILEINKNLQTPVLFLDIIHSEQRKLQKVFDQLQSGEWLPKQSTTKSLLQILSGKEGILRKYSLGKRVDYSARSVISPNPHLSLNQVGIPVEMALVLYRPFLLASLLKKGKSLEEAKQTLLQGDSAIFPLLNQVIQNRPVLLNRAPTLHRLGIQGFQPILTLGKTIQLHPLVTVAFNADFDGDQMAVLLPLTKKAQKEIQERVMADSQILDPKNGNLIDAPTQDIILGIYYLTRTKSRSLAINVEEKKSTPSLYYEASQMEKDYEKGKINFATPLFVPLPLTGKQFVSQDEQKFLLTTFGKWKFNQILPPTFPYYINDLKYYNQHQTSPAFADIFAWPFVSDQEPKNLSDYYEQGFYNEEEFTQQKKNLWAECKESLEKIIAQKLAQKSSSSLYYLWDSGARANIENLTQVFGMRGNMTDYKGATIETPILSSLKEGLNPFEFFISVYGAMKGMMDTALKTAEAGYLTRQLVETVQNLIITTEDCQTPEGISLQELTENTAFGQKGSVLISLAERIAGRYLAQDVTVNGKLMLASGTLLLAKEIALLQENNVSAVKVRSPFTCSLIQGICQKCYGGDLSKNQAVIELGTAVGIIAAQSLGEPGTQLTMNTFHTGGVTGEEDIVQGLPKVKEILGNVLPDKKKQAILAQETGEIIAIIEDEKNQQITIKQKAESQEFTYTFDLEKRIKVKVGQIVQRGENLTAGKVNLEKLLEIVGREVCHVEITKPGDSSCLTSDIVNYQEFCQINQDLRAKNKEPAQARNLVFGLKQIAKFSPSFLASISFQETAKALINYSIFRPVDYLQGVKENLVVGQLAPVGSGLEERQK
ncbi:2912_t:CDS:2 [Entrophospora sp. SA101]|nr:2912_t:CDS:2 [Entrophospora sp. SA101]